MERVLPRIIEGRTVMKPGELVRSKVTVSLYCANPGIDKGIAKGYEVPGADSHLEYIEAIIIAEAEGKLSFRQ